jgi:hypothetical protein
MAFGFLALGCRQSPPTKPFAEEASPACIEVLASAARAPKPPSLGPRYAEAHSRGAEADVTRLAAVACPLGWVGALDGADAPLARRVFERCADGDAPLALVCARKGRPSPEETAALVAWAARHPLAREEDGPALRAAAAELERAPSTEDALNAILRVSYPRR